MLSFKEYVALLEGILDGTELVKRASSYEHNHVIDNHKVSVYYSRMSGNDDHYAVDFDVNHSFGSGNTKQAKGSSSHKIATFVRASLNHFIKNVKPETIYAKGNTDEKHKFYGKYFDHMSKKHGFATSYHKTWGHELHTNV